MAWDVIFYATAEGSVPGADFLDGCPAKVRGTILAVLDAVAAAPPPAFSGGGKWEAMHGDMGGYYEIRVTGPGREQFRLFCILENAEERTLTARGLRGPAIASSPGCARKPGRSSATATTPRSEGLAASTLRALPDASPARLGWQEPFRRSGAPRRSRVQARYCRSASPER
jgi:hypothetical protein